MDDIEGELGAEIVTVFGRVGLSGVGGNTDLASRAKGGFALEGDDVGRSDIVEEISM